MPMSAVNPQEELGELIRRSRDAKGWSIRHTAQVVGVDHTWLSRVERGLREPDDEVLVRLAVALERDVAELLAARGDLPPIDVYLRARYGVPPDQAAFLQANLEWLIEHRAGLIDKSADDSSRRPPRPSDGDR